MTARNAAEANIAGIGFGNADGTNKSSSQMGVAVGNCLAGGRTISFAFDADPFIHVMLDSGAYESSVARGTIGFQVTLTNVTTGAIVFKAN